MLWRLPFEFATPEFAKAYLFPNENHNTSHFLLAWFLFGGLKTSLMMLWDKTNPDGWNTSTAYRIKALLLVPFTPLIKFNQSWYRLPPVKAENNS